LSLVSIEKCHDYNSANLQAALYKTFENLGGVEKFVRPGMKVVLKPNLVMKKRPEDAATTHPGLVKELIAILEEAGAVVSIAESPGGLYNQRSLKGIYSVCGMEKAVESSNAELNYDLSEIEVDNPAGELLKKVTVIKPLVDADVIINLPKLKTHGQMVYTGAVKNMFGAVPGVLKAEYHFRQSEYNDFANALIDIFLSVKPSLNIMDAVVGMDGSGPTSGNAKQIGLIIASENAFELDRAVLDFVGIDPSIVPIIRNAIKRGLCSESMNELKLMGVSPKNLKLESFIVPELGALRTIQFFDKGILKYVTSILKPRPEFDHRLCVGCGDCAKNCPPHIIEMNRNRPKADLQKCIRCFCCQELCPIKAITIKRNFIVNFLIKSRKKYIKKEEF
jgi:uncharacterized protein (DUF362 family)/Pyruvate/2-oxoacid:ferredoxin oxidoreductase delta subunit